MTDLDRAWNLVQIRFDLVEGDEAFLGQQHRFDAKNQFAPVSVAVDRQANGTPRFIGMDFVVGTIYVTSRLQQPWIEQRRIADRICIHVFGWSGTSLILFVLRGVHQLLSPVAIAYCIS